MKKTIYLVTALILSFTVVGCSGNTPAAETDIDTSGSGMVEDSAEVAEDTEAELEEVWNLESEAEQLSDEMDALLDSLENEEL